MEINLSGKKAIVAGGGGAIGFAIAKGLSKAGAAVTVFDLNIEGLKGQSEVTGKLVDLTCVEAIREAVDDAGGSDGIDVMVNTAGINPAMSVEEMTEADWDRVLGVNLKSCFFLTQAVQPYMRLRGGGAIVLVSSCSASLGYPGLSAYGASKAGIEGLVRGLACDLAPDNIRVNAIAPGTTKTPMTRGLWEDAQKRGAHEATIPLKRLGDVNDNAMAALFLACDLSSYITGAVIPVDGGLTAMQQDFIDLRMRGWT
jgi:NAD(P)-dependent dehydrogenase (short-subunit alcohol dehydrogenase family)